MHRYVFTEILTVNTAHRLLPAADWRTWGYDAFQAAAERSSEQQSANRNHPWSNEAYSSPSQQPAQLEGFISSYNPASVCTIQISLGSLLVSFFKLPRMQRHQFCSFHRICVVVGLVHFFESPFSKRKFSSDCFFPDFSPRCIIPL